MHEILLDMPQKEGQINALLEVAQDEEQSAQKQVVWPLNIK